MLVKWLINVSQMVYYIFAGGPMAIWAMPKWTAIFFQWGFPKLAGVEKVSKIDDAKQVSATAVGTA